MTSAMIDKSSYDAPTQRDRQHGADLRDRLAEFEAAAQRLLTPRRPLVLVHAEPATCHPGKPKYSRGLCRPCYDHHRGRGNLHHFPTEIRSSAYFVDDYKLLRSEGYTKRQIAERLGMNLDTLRTAYRRAVRAGALTPDRRLA